jgi:hypothetical protein
LLRKRYSTTPRRADECWKPGKEAIDALGGSRRKNDPMDKSRCRDDDARWGTVRFGNLESVTGWWMVDGGWENEFKAWSAASLCLPR